MAKHLELYLNCASDYSIQDAAGRKYTPKQARGLVDAGKVKNWNVGFQRLIEHDYDVNAVREYFSSPQPNTVR